MKKRRHWPVKGCISFLPFTNYYRHLSGHCEFVTMYPMDRYVLQETHGMRTERSSSHLSQYHISFLSNGSFDESSFDTWMSVEGRM